MSRLRLTTARCVPETCGERCLRSNKPDPEPQSPLMMALRPSSVPPVKSPHLPAVASKVHPDPQGTQDLMATQAAPETTAAAEAQAPMPVRESPSFPTHHSASARLFPAQPDPQAHPDHRVPLAHRELLDSTELPDPKALPDLRDHPDPRAMPDPRDPLDPLATSDPPHLPLLDAQVLPDAQDKPDLVDSPAAPEATDVQEPRDNRELRDLRGAPDPRDNSEPPDSPVSLAPQEAATTAQLPVLPPAINFHSDTDFANYSTYHFCILCLTFLWLDK